jgi:NADH dehydrogenase
MSKKNMVVIGGGFAGATLTRKLEKLLPDDWEIYLLSKTNFITYNPLLAEVVGASILPGHVLAPLRQMVKRARVRMVTVTDIDLKNQVIHYENDQPGKLHFDQLAVTAGVKANVGMVPGMVEHAMPLKTVGDAVFIRNHLISRIEQATIHPDPEVRKHLTTFIFIGGGFSGVEVAGEIDDFLKSATRYYKNVHYDDCKIILLHGTECLLPELSRKLGKKTEQIFTKRGIDVWLKARVVEVKSDCVVLKTGEIIHGGTVVCTIGTTPHNFLSHTELPSERGRLVVEPDMSVAGAEGIWSIGDCAVVPNAWDGNNSPPTAQFAERQAKQLAVNINNAIRNKPTKPFSYKPGGSLASIGHNKAVAEIYGLELSGFIGWLMWRGVYLMKVPTLARKVRLFLEWTWAMLFPPDLSHLDFKTTESKFRPDTTATNTGQ